MTKAQLNYFNQNNIERFNQNNAASLRWKYLKLDGKKLIPIYTGTPPEEKDSQSKTDTDYYQKDRWNDNCVSLKLLELVTNIIVRVLWKNSLIEL